ncbi:uncharacterized protein LOC135393521 isoform X1 [Ornithodoros turicata]|uniref:uncharacterized protein LOC135393521 isoform X1 n=1 Tax=Ornithodoros turicata TaxID=34597 RepID=UPI003138BE12
MAYPMSNTDKLSYVQMQTLAKVRSTHGYHLIITNPFLSKQESAGGEVTVCKLPRGLTLGTTQTFLFYFPNLTGSAMIKYRIRNDDGETGDTKGAYMEILPTRDGMTFYQYSSAIGIKPKTIFSGSAEFTQFALVQLEAASNGYTKLFYNGVYKNTADALNFGAHFVQHTIDKTFNPLMVMEIHHTYISDNSKIFNTSVDFKKPELPLSPGAYILWEGSSNGPRPVADKEGTEPEHTRAEAQHQRWLQFSRIRGHRNVYHISPNESLIFPSLSLSLISLQFVTNTFIKAWGHAPRTGKRGEIRTPIKK